MKVEGCEDGGWECSEGVDLGVLVRGGERGVRC